ncbi:hypothetical protein, partial [Cronobacter turicensis]|uniref:hypothetical protein n=1 Tax=Cronobacter turicensis TaxID=413502 RepID=UPI001F20C356
MRRQKTPAIDDERAFLFVLFCSTLWCALNEYLLPCSGRKNAFKHSLGLHRLIKTMPLIKEKPSVKTEGLITLMGNKQRMTVLLT